MTDDATNTTPSEEEEPKPFTMGEVSEAEAVPATAEAVHEPEVEPLSLTDRMMGVYTDPEPTFENLKQAGPRATDWLVPLLLMLVVTLIVSLIKFDDPEVRREIMRQQEQRMEAAVEDGSMTQEQADAAMDQMSNMGGLFKIISVAGIVVGTPIMFLLIALFHWLVTRFAFKGTATFYLTFTALCLTAYITMLEPLMTLILGFATGNPFASLSPGLFFEHDATNKLYLAMSALKPISLWGYAVFAIALTKIGEISKAKAYGLVFGTWLIITVLSVAFGSGQMFM